MITKTLLDRSIGVSSTPTLRYTKKRRFRFRERRSFCIRNRKEELLVLGRPGSDLLSQGLSHSTIGAEEFNGRVRDGIGFMLLARTTRPAKDKENEASSNAKRSSAVLGLDPRTHAQVRAGLISIVRDLLGHVIATDLTVLWTLKMRAIKPI